MQLGTVLSNFIDGVDIPLVNPSRVLCKFNCHFVTTKCEALATLVQNGLLNKALKDWQKVAEDSGVQLRVCGPSRRKKRKRKEADPR